MEIGLGKKKTHLYPFGCKQKPEGDKDASESGSRIGVRKFGSGDAEDRPTTS
jgi:hypothetical protein